MRPTWAAIIRWQIVDQGRVTGEGSEREMGFINSEPSLQEFMPHQLDSADNTPPPTGIKIIKTNKKNHFRQLAYSRELDNGNSFLISNIYLSSKNLMGVGVIGFLKDRLLGKLAMNIEKPLEMPY